jgi:hypothetical protein
LVKGALLAWVAIMRNTLPGRWLNEILGGSAFRMFVGPSTVSPVGNSRVMKLHDAGTCSGCHAQVGKGERAWWDAEEKKVWCLPCNGERGAVTDLTSSETIPVDQDISSVQSVVDDALSSEPIAEPPRLAALDRGTPGKSSQDEYERLHRKEQERLEQKWGPLAGVAKFLHNDPQWILAYGKGAEGERRVAAHLENALGDHVVCLHDRRVPGTKGNIDHLVVSSSGIWIVDTKHYKGKVEHRAVGGWLKTDLKLFVGRRDRSGKADGLRWQVEAVRRAIGDATIPIHPALCFVAAEW